MVIDEGDSPEEPVDHLFGLASRCRLHGFKYSMNSSFGLDKH